jgi:hypothetical protein
MTTPQLPSADNLAAVRALVSLSRADLSWADQYLHWAEQLLDGVCSRDQYAALCRDRESLRRLTRELRVATEHGDWTQVRYLAQRAATVHERTNDAAAVFEVAETLYAPRTLLMNANALALNGVLVAPSPTTDARRERDAVVDELRLLAAADHERVGFYRWRLAHFEGLSLASPAEDQTKLENDDVQTRILTAAQQGDFKTVLGLLDSVSVTPSGTHFVGSLALEPSPSRVERLVAPFPAAALERARGLGLSLERIPQEESLNRYLTDGRAQWPSGELPGSESGADRSQGAIVSANLRENLDLLLTHAFVTSAGSRYLPWFGSEILLVETFPETDANAPTQLLARLGLTHRCGLPRPVVEDALRTHTISLCSELGLDPLECRLTCIPFDAYLRLAPRYGWGRQELWTHFDGYRVTDQLHLQPLVGGDVRYGGSGDLCSIDHGFASERLIMRLAIVRRERFLVRETHTPMDEVVGGRGR